MHYINKIINEFNFFIFIILAWAYYFLNSTVKVEDGAESVSLIKPLFYLLLIVSIFTFLQTFVKNLKTSGQLFEKNKIYFLISVLTYFLGINFFGYMFSTFFFYIVMSYLLGFKGKLILIPPCFSLIIIYFFFYKILKIPLPLW